VLSVPETVVSLITAGLAVTALIGIIALVFLKSRSTGRSIGRSEFKVAAVSWTTITTIIAAALTILSLLLTNLLK
jgi:hypothetical protein